MKKEYDIFGIETDNSIDQKAEETKRRNYEKRAAILDRDMLGYVSCYGMLDKMACEPTITKKKDFIVNYVRNEVALDRKPEAFSSGKFSKRMCAYKEYMDKPIEDEKLKLLADYIIDHFKYADGVKFQRINCGDRSFYHIDANGHKVSPWNNISEEDRNNGWVNYKDGVTLFEREKLEKEEK